MRKYIAILIRGENTIEEDIFYIKAVEMFKGEVLFIYDNEDFEDIFNKLILVKGILLTGGYDVGRVDFYLIKYALQNNLKIFGICQGMQSMALYGTCNKLEKIGNNNHDKNRKYVHSVDIYPGRLNSIIMTDKCMVNSHHQQTVFSPGLFRVVAKSDDGLIEAIENDNHIFQIGVQWHPERMIEYDLVSRRIFSSFVN